EPVQGPPNMNYSRDGKFEFAPVPPGAYIIRASASIMGKTFFASAPVDVISTDVEDLTVQFVPGMTVKGTIRVEPRAGEINATPQAVDVSLFSGARGSSNAVWDADGASFTFPQVGPGKYKLRVSPRSQGYYVKSASLSDQD